MSFLNDSNRAGKKKGDPEIAFFMMLPDV